MPAGPPTIDGARRSYIDARGVHFHVTEAGSPDGRPVVALHGWPQHHWVYRDLLADPPEGLRIIAPDLPGYGWSGPPPHRWAKDDVAADVLALMDAMGLERVLLIGHDWGAFVGYRMILTAPERFDGFLALNMAHPWVPPTVLLPHMWRFWYQVPMATIGGWLQRRTKFVRRVFHRASALDGRTAWVYASRFRDPVVARAARDTYRTFLVRELAAGGRTPAPRATVPIRCVFGVGDTALHPSLASAETARADDYTVELVEASHFIVDERPDKVRAALIALAEETR
ncbi:alpha/beta hydrolase [Mycolicibacterium phlei]|jgi:pimeloyl-ACP methyl ester carboxylesterase|nr:alpha/beta hydrolase [Mycolicibacterium phlei]AMO63110.1 Haloalkane dehalogenase [Mycolicibacterium phlei]KXW79171.1 alpha/beta hydrolase [Mycolicibacterium phlei DSM 43071]STZ21570.1 alpha/beta hydrolase [Mycolicibacterium phlei]VEG11207.1 alpha/beta hydrolase [Mycobacteroides chelonae]